MRETESRSDLILGLSLVEVMLLLVFAALIISATDNVEGGGQEPKEVEKTTAQDAPLQARLEAVMDENTQLEKRLRDMTLFVDKLKLKVDAKVPSKESLKRGYSLCQKDDNTLIEASIQNGVEAVHVIGEVPSDLKASLTKGDQTSDLDQIVSFLQDVYHYEKAHKCRFNYRLKYATDNDYRKAREGFEKYFYPEKIMRTG